MGYIASNIALKPQVLESRFELLEVTESICIEDPDSDTSGWLSKRTGKGINVSLSSEQIHWEDEFHDDIDHKEIYQQFKDKLKDLGHIR